MFTYLTKEYDALGRRTSFSAAKGTQSIISNSYTYDVLGRLTAVTNGEDTAAYTYDANSNRLTTTVNGVLKSSTAYNKANLPTEVNSYVSGALKSTETYRYAYSGYIQHYSKVEPQGNTSGVTYYYDNGGRMYAERSSCSDTITNETVYRCSNRFVYDEYGNVSKFIYNNRYSDNLYQCDYTYNNINQLTAFCKVEIIYDEDGNFTGNSITTNTAYTYDNSNNLTTVTQDGEVIKTYSYDGFNRMSGALVNGVASSYTYDGDNLRQTKTVNGVQTQHILDGADVIADISGESIKTFVRGAELEFLKTSDGATQEYMTSYPRGDVRYLISQDGTVNDYTYTAYGEKVGTNDNTVNPFGYCGEYFDAETDLVYLRNRYYDPEMHRFITEDPAKDGVNWYAYCNGNPVMFTDPWGTNAIIITNKNAAQVGNFSPQGHTSAIYQNENKEWFYTYWGNKAAAVIAIPSEYMDSLVSFNGYISRFLSENECQNITKDYTNATYVVGDFTESLNAAYDDVRNVFNNRFSNGKTVVVGGGNLVYQGHNSPYNLAWNNCLQRTVSDFGKGILPDGTNVSKYLGDCGYSNTPIPNDAKKEFADIFINKSFTYSDSLKSIINYKVNYNVNSKSNTQKSENKYKYANAVCDANPVLSLWQYLK